MKFTLKIVPYLWYDKEAKGAALFYISLFDQSKLLNVNVIENTPSGNAETVNFELAGQQFAAISAGPFFRFNPSISLMIACYSVEEVNTKWKALSEGGTELMPLGEYPFSCLPVMDRLFKRLHPICFSQMSHAEKLRKH